MKFSRSALTLVALLTLGGAFFPIVSRAADPDYVCTCSYTKSAVGGKPSEVQTYALTGTYEDIPIDGSANCTLACGAWVDNRSEDTGLIYTKTDAIYELTDEAAAAQAAAEAQAKRDLLTPKLNINIPGLSLTSPWTSGNNVVTKFLPEYIAGVYRYALGIAAIIAIVMIMVGGAQYVIGSGTGGESIDAAKKRITNALTGLVLVMSAYVILYVVNPNLTAFSSLSLEYQYPVYFENDTEKETYAASGSASSGSVGTPSGSNIFGGRKADTPSEMIADIEAVAKKMAAAGYGISITDGLRTLEEQKTAISKYCQNPAGSSSCNAKVAGQPACILSTLSASDCPHTSGRAIDLWATKSTTSGQQSVIKSQCAGSSGITYCRNDPAQAALISAMKAQGYCVLNTEPWHFEKPVFSTGSCN